MALARQLLLHRSRDGLKRESLGGRSRAFEAPKWKSPRRGQRGPGGKQDAGEAGDGAEDGGGSGRGGAAQNQKKKTLAEFDHYPGNSKLGITTF